MGDAVNRQTVKYAIVRFAPFLETGEFANVGIVMVAPKLGLIDYKLTRTRYARVTNFFNELEAKVFKETIVTLTAELERVKALAMLENEAGGDRMASSGVLMRLFDELVRPRETVVQFSESRVALCEDPKQFMAQQYAHYVGRNFVTKEYVEEKIARRIKGVLQRADVAEDYQRTAVGDHKYQVAFPFVEKVENPRQARLIKPLNLAQDSSTKIADQGGQWQFKLRKLVGRNFVNAERVFFAVQGPEQGDSARYDAFCEAVYGLAELGALVKPQSDDRELLEFVKG
ncbi:MAG: DUF3037 domain-containing protein [Pseudomonadota bacterium]|nr:DUF3037 domain-containing protein [Pseudomonadota bacterium]